MEKIDKDGLCIVLFAIACFGLYALLSHQTGIDKVEAEKVRPAITQTSAPAETPTETPTPKPKKKAKKKVSGKRIKAKITAYCPCRECSGKWGHSTSTGARATEGRTVAVDPKVIPYGSKIIIEGHTYIAEDCGGGVKGNHIDIFFESHDDVEKFGCKTREVVVK